MSREMSYSPEQIEEQADRVGIVGEDVGKTADMLRFAAATLRQQAARVDGDAVERGCVAMYPEWPKYHQHERETFRKEMRAALEAALSAQPAERQGDDGITRTDYQCHNCGTQLAVIRPAAPVGVPDENWLADQLCDLRNRWGEHEPGWLETDDNHPDDWMAKELRKRWLAAAPSAPQGSAQKE